MIFDKSINHKQTEKEIKKERESGEIEEKRRQRMENGKL